MEMGLAFYILMLLWLVLWVWSYRTPNPYNLAGSWGLQFILFLLLGWKVFGPPLRG